METSAVSVRARTFALPILDRLPSFGVWLLGFLFVSFVAGSAGGFRPTTWAWTALLSWWIAVIALIGKRRLALGLLDLTTIAGILAFTGWFALSAVWSQSVPSTLDATIRFVAYAGLVVAALLVVERTTVPHLVGGVTAGIGILALYALGTRVLPDRLGELQPRRRLTRTGSPCRSRTGTASASSARSGSCWRSGSRFEGSGCRRRAIAAAALPVLTCSMYFTFSRGAWLSLLIGFAAALALDPRRLQLAFGTAVVGAPSGLALLVASRMDGLTDRAVSLAEATHDGHRFVPVLLVLVAISAATAVALALVDRRVDVPRKRSRGVGGRTHRRARDRRRCDVRLVRSPVHLAQRAWDTVSTEASRTAEPTTAGCSTSARAAGFALWRAASTHFASIPSQVPAASTFWQVWAASPRQNYSAIEPHSIYLGTLAELGVIGLALLLVVLVPPLGAALRSRHSPLVPAVLAAYVCWMVHSGIDWDWTLVGVTGPGLLCGVALLAGSRDEARAPRPIVWPPRRRGRRGRAPRVDERHRKRAAVLGQRRDRRRSRRSGRRRGAWRAAIRALVGRGVGTRRGSPPGSGTQGRSARGLQEGRRSRSQQLARVDTACGNGDGCRARHAEAAALRLNPLAPRV